MPTVALEPVARPIYSFMYSPDIYSAVSGKTMPHAVPHGVPHALVHGVPHERRVL